MTRSEKIRLRRTLSPKVYSDAVSCARLMQTFRAETLRIEAARAAEMRKAAEIAADPEAYAEWQLSQQLNGGFNGR